MRKIRIIVLQIVGFICFISNIKADGGLWIPSDSLWFKKDIFLLERKNIYDENSPSLKDAIVRFGNGCTGVVISEDGLVLTNHHCAYKYIQKKLFSNNASSKEGFIANQKRNEIVNQNLSVRFFTGTIDVTDCITPPLSIVISEKKRSKYIQEKKEILLKRYRSEYPNYSIELRSTNRGNRYFLYLYEEFKDIRLVYVPPISIGKFGGNTDNWMWPRYTGDFALFRIYANKENRPADFSTENIPYKPRKIIPISSKGIKENDFAMILGYPGGTDKNITSDGLNSLINIDFPIQISLLDAQLKLLDKFMSQDQQIRSRYNAQVASFNNTKKKLEGVIEGCKATKAVELKKKAEDTFIENLRSNDKWQFEYSNLLPTLKSKYDSINRYTPPFLYYYSGISNIKLIKMAEMYQSFMNNWKNHSQDELQSFLSKQKKKYEEFDIELDKAIFTCVMNMYQQNVATEFHFSNMISEQPLDIETWKRKVYKESDLSSYEKFEKVLLTEPEKMLGDPAVIIARDISVMLDKHVWKSYPNLSESIDSLYRVYEQATNKINKTFGYPESWADANGGMRLSYGKVKGYTFQDVTYPYYTTLNEMIKKHENSEDEEFIIPPYLKSLGDAYISKNEELPVCFITDCQTSSGNSGSPVLNGKGELIGLNFDRNWEGTMSDYLYSPDLSRNISVDSRYILFVLDKFSGAQNIIDELIIH